MSFRKMEVSHRIRRIRHTFQTKKTTDEELKRFESVMDRNTKVSQFASAFRKDLAATMTTGFREENVDKRKKKVEELSMAQNLKEASVDLEYLNTSCLHHVINGFGTVLYQEADEKIKLEMALERRVHEELSQFTDYEKNSGKLKDKLYTVSTDLEIAQKDYEKDQSHAHQEACDAIQMKYEGLRDAFVTDIFLSSVVKEFQISDHVMTTMKLKRDYFKRMAEIYDDAIPAVESMVANAVPRPMFNVPLEEHLSTHSERVAVPIQKLCDFLREHGFKEKGLFRVNGNAARMKRIHAALDCGLYDADEKNYVFDQHAIAGVLKMYVRDLPDPLIQKSLHQDWIKAFDVEGEERFAAIERCIKKMNRGNRQNLIYLMRFLVELETYKDETAMTAYNLSIVFAPNITGMVYDGMNAFGVMLIEFLITHGARIFHAGLDAIDSPLSAFTRAQSSISPRSFRPKEKAPPPPVDVPSSSNNLIDLHEEDDFSDENGACSSNGDSLHRSSTERRPNRPPPPSFRASVTETPKTRPMSYTLALENRSQESASLKPSTKSTEAVVSDTPIAPERKRLSVMSISGLSRVGPNASQSTSQESSSGSLVIDGGDHRTLVSLDGEPSTSSAPPPIMVQPPPQSTKPKPPLPVKPKDLTNESSRL